MDPDGGERVGGRAEQGRGQDGMVAEAALLLTSGRPVRAHTVHRFASATTAQLPRSKSRYRDPTTEAVGGMSQSLVDDNNWANPPFSLIPLVLRLINAQRAAATVLVPVWRAQP